jgi:anti-sigma factor RsiW
VIPRITCQELVDFLNQYLEGELSPVQQADFEQHLSACPACVAYMNSYKETVALGRRVMCDSPQALVDNVPEDLLQAILAARTKPQG